MGTDAVSDANQVTLLLKLVPEEALPQQHTLGLYLEELFQVTFFPPPACPRNSLSWRLQETGRDRSHFGACPSTSAGCSPSTAHPHCSRSLGQCMFTYHSKRRPFHDQLMVDVLERANKKVQCQRGKAWREDRGKAQAGYTA
ncbi:unnamed protein product [Caretta caretta]